MLHLFLISVLTIAATACEGPQGAIGPQGPQGPPGLSLREVSLQQTQGTISAKNYTKGNPYHVSIPIGNPLLSEPAVLFVGIKNEHEVYYSILFEGTIWGGEDGDDHTVEGESGWHVVIFDSTKQLLGQDYQVKFLQ